MKGVGVTTAVLLRFCQARDDLQELHHRPGPSMSDEERKRARVRRARVHEVDRLAVDARAEVFELVESGLLRAPVVLVAPVVDQLVQVVHRDAVVPARVVDAVREAGPREPGAQIVEDRVVDTDPERFDRCVHRVGPSVASGRGAEERSARGWRGNLILAGR